MTATEVFLKRRMVRFGFKTALLQLDPWRCASNPLASCSIQINEIVLNLKHCAPRSALSILKVALH